MSIELDAIAQSTDPSPSSCCGPTAVQDAASSGCCGPAPVKDAAASGCCGPAPVEGTAPSGCCASSVASVPATVVSVNEVTPGRCCGGTAPREGVDIHVGLGLRDTLDDGLAERLRTADTWPYALPAWLSATENSLEGAKPWHSVARDGDKAVFLPGFVFDSPGLVDADPRTYLGWESASGEVACCGVKSCCGGQSQVEEFGAEALFPALVLGSPLGYRSDTVAVGQQDAQLTADLINNLVPAALGKGIRSIVAPWVSDRPVNGPLLATLHANGAAVSFWGEENHLPLEHDSYQAHVDALPTRKRRRIKEDDDKAAATGARLTRVDGEELRPLVGRIAELTLLNRQKYDGGEGTDHITALLNSLIDDGADVRAHLAYKDDVIVGSSLTIRQGSRLIVKWAGFDYEAVGDRSGLYFSLVLNRPLQDAFADGVTSLEIGPGVDKAKRLRGCRPRAIYTALLVADESLRGRVADLQGAYGGERRAALGVETAEEPEQSSAARVLGRLRPKKAATENCCG